MTLELYGHPFSSFTAKVLVALYETGTPFTLRQFGPDDPQAAEEWAAISPFQRFPLLVDSGRAVFETSIIIEYLQTRYPAAVRLIPDDPDLALETRLIDRLLDTYVLTPILTLSYDATRPEPEREPFAAGQARAHISHAYAFLEQRLDGRQWAAGDQFTLADCAASSALLYGHWTLPIPKTCPRVRDYRKRLMARPAFARVIEQARPFRSSFPLGAPIQD